MRSSNWQPAAASVKIDPEVARLLNDIPAVKLPKELVREGWGHSTVAQMRTYGVAPTQRSTVVQPTFDHNCVQCGRPITAGRRGWTDHAGRTKCDGQLLDDPSRRRGVHFVEGQQAKWEDELLDDFKQRLKDDINKQLYGRSTVPVRSTKSKKKDGGQCSSTKYANSCQHQCSEADDHFGFHQCKFCKHLWR